MAARGIEIVVATGRSLSAVAPAVMALPFIRGSVNMVQMLSMGMKTLTDAADMLGTEAEEPTKFEKWLAEKLGKSVDKVVMAVAGILWAQMLKVEYGVFFMAMVLTLWIMRNKPQYRLFVGMGVAALCTAISPFYLAATMGFMAIHFYNGEQSESGKVFNYAAYPAMLLVCALIPLFL